MRSRQREGVLAHVQREARFRVEPSIRPRRGVLGRYPALCNRKSSPAFAAAPATSRALHRLQRARLPGRDLRGRTLPARWREWSFAGRPLRRRARGRSRHACGEHELPARRSGWRALAHARAAAEERELEPSPARAGASAAEAAALLGHQREVRPTVTVPEPSSARASVDSRHGSAWKRIVRGVATPFPGAGQRHARGCRLHPASIYATRPARSAAPRGGRIVVGTEARLPAGPANVACAAPRYVSESCSPPSPLPRHVALRAKQNPRERGASPATRRDGRLRGAAVPAPPTLQRGSSSSWKSNGRGFTTVHRTTLTYEPSRPPSHAPRPSTAPPSRVRATAPAAACKPRCLQRAEFSPPQPAPARRSSPRGRPGRSPTPPCSHRERRSCSCPKIHRPVARSDTARSSAW